MPVRYVHTTHHDQCVNLVGCEPRLHSNEETDLITNPDILMQLLLQFPRQVLKL